jgi:amidase
VDAAEVQQLAKEAGFVISEKAVEDFGVLLGSLESAIQHVMLQEDELPRPDLNKYPRTNINIPTGQATNKGAWATCCVVKCTQPFSSLLAGRTVAIKDNTALAGVRCLNGITPHDGKEWVPVYDATVVTRVLDAGGVILGKAGW